MNLPLDIETAAEYHCRRILESLRVQEDDKSLIKTEIPKIKHLL
jgi:hypothetical protein